MSTVAKANHGLSEHSHGFGAPIQIRSARLKSKFSKDFPAISAAEEQWRYLPVSELNSLLENQLAPIVSGVSVEATPGASFNWIDATEELIGSVDIPEDLLSAKAWESTPKVGKISIESSDQLETARIEIRPIDASARALHIFIEAKANSNSIIVLNHAGQSSLSENIEISVGDNANATVVSLQQWDSQSVHISSQFAKLGRNANLKHIVITLGGSTVRVSSQTKFAAEGAQVEMLGAYFANSKQYFENRLFVDHAVPNCKSRVTYKGALQGQKAHTVWVGDVLIRKAAEGTDTYELNRNLLLTDGARADSVPNLEIETGQIAGAGHASASGRFDDEQLFYLQARGIPELEARQLVVRGFLNEIIQQIGIEDLQIQLTDAIEAKLGVAN